MRWSTWAPRTLTTCTAATRTCAPSCSGNDREFLELGRDRAPDEHLRIGRRGEFFRSFALCHRLHRDRKRVDEGLGLRKRIAEVRFAEIGPVVAALASERPPVRRGRGDDQRMVVLERLDKAARIAGGD